MADGQQYDYRTDPAFLKADPRRMTEYLDSIDPVFKNAPVEDKVAYVTHLRSLGGGGVPGGKYAGEPTEFEKERGDEGLVSSTLGRLGGWAQHAFTTPEGLASTLQMAPPSAEGVVSRYRSIRDLPAADVAREKAGRSILYRTPAALGTITGFSDPVESEHAADLGKTSAVASQALGEAAPALLYEAGSRLGIPARNRLARSFYEPGTTTLKPGLEKSLRWAGGGVGFGVGGYLGRELGGGHGIAAYEGAGMGGSIGGGLGGAFAPYAFRKLFPPPAKPFSPYSTTPPPPVPPDIGPWGGAGGGTAAEGIQDFYKQRSADVAQHEAGLSKRLDEAWNARQKELANTERLRQQHAQDLIARGKEQDAIDKRYADTVSDIEEARQRQLADDEQLKEQHAQALMRREKEQAALDAKYGREGKAVPLSQSPYATQHEAAAAFERGEKGPYNLLSESPVPHDPFSPAGPGDIATDPFGPKRSGGDRPRPLAPVIATPEEFGVSGGKLKGGTIPQRMSILKSEAEAQGMYSAARGKVGKKLHYGERTGGAFGKVTPSAPPPETPPSLTVPTSTPPLRFTTGGEPIEVESERYAGRERRTEGNAPIRRLYDLQKEMLETEAERGGKELGSMESMKSGMSPADGITDVLYPGKKFKDLPEGGPQQKAVKAVFDQMKLTKGRR